MLGDITLGQYYPSQSPIHRLDPRGKLGATALFMTLIFLAHGIAGYGIITGLLILGIILARLPLRVILRGLKPILFIVAFTFLLNILFTQSGEVLVTLWFIRITQGGLISAVRLAVRLILLVVGTSLLTLTTTPIELTDGLERVLKPLNWMRFPVHEMSMMMTIALRFIPTLAEEADRIMKAQAARGADFDTGGILQRAKGLIPLLVPLFVGAFRRADDLATAMEARCYAGKEGRTSMKEYHLKLPDYLWLLLLSAIIAAVCIWGL